MIRRLVSLSAALAVASATFGIASEPSDAQTITVKCYVEACTTGTDGKETCVKREFDCPKQLAPATSTA